MDIQKPGNNPSPQFLLLYLFTVNFQPVSMKKMIFICLIFPLFGTGQKSPMFTSIEEAMQNPEEVVNLNLSGQGLTAVPPEIAQFKNLTYLNLSQNDLTELPSFLFDLVELTTLYLSHNKIRVIPEELGNLKQLFELYVDHNLLTTLPRSIGRLNAMGYYFNHNRITELPDEICTIRSEVINLSYNQIAFLPDSIGYMTTDDLKLHHNRLFEIPESIGNMTKTHYIDLSYNPITTLPKTLFKCVELEKLYLKKTKIKRKEIYALEFVMDWCKMVY